MMNDFFIGSHKRSQREEGVYTETAYRQGLSGIKAVIF